MRIIINSVAVLEIKQKNNFLKQSILLKIKHLFFKRFFNRLNSVFNINSIHV
jgi:hypothetical protein